MGLISKILSKLAGKSDYAQMAQDVQQRRLNYSPFTISNQNPQSWAPDLHPNGREHSSYINSIDYDGDTKKMQVSFTNGFAAEYDAIDEDEAKAFNEAESKGRFFNEHFANRSYTQI